MGLYTAVTSADRGSGLLPATRDNRLSAIDDAAPDQWNSRDGHAVSPRILIVEDDVRMRRMVADYLEQHGMVTAAAAQSQEMARQTALHKPDLVILDLRLGEEDGLDLLRQLRTRSDVPVIIITGHHHDEIDRVVGLELGADDYVTKPFGLRELLARIRAVLRRNNARHTAPPGKAGHGLNRFGGWTLDRHARRLTNPNGTPVALTKAEFTLLTAFLDAPQRPLSREQLLQATRVHEDAFDRSIDVQVLRLRRKLEAEASAPRVIRTERGIGYMFSLTVERQ